MISLNDFILMKAIYNEQLHSAVLAKDRASIEAIVNERYADDLKGGFICLESIDTDRLYNEHMEQLNDEKMLQRIL